MDSFETSILDRSVFLRTAREAVRFSFIVRNSISYLDLELCQDSTPTNSCCCCRLRSSKDFINTDEKFRKFFSPSRRLLYTLHLDLPKGREHGLKKVPESVEYSPFSDRPHIAKLQTVDGSEVLRYLLSTKGLISGEQDTCADHMMPDDFLLFKNFVEYALDINVPKLKILKWLLEVRLFSFLEPETANKFIDCFYPEATNSELFKVFVLQFDIAEFMAEHEQSKILEDLLYHSRLYERRDLKDDRNGSIDENILVCIYCRFYSNIGAVLKYVDSATFTYGDHELLLDGILERADLSQWALERPMQWLKQERFNHILAIICMHSDGCAEGASEALRLIWCSVPDPCITYDEIRIGFEAAFSEKELVDIYGFYVRATGEFHEYAEPRPLKHLCRTILRKTFRKNKFWIPEGVRRTGLPKSLQSFLNLEKAQTFSI